MQAERRPFYDPRDILEQARARLDFLQVQASGEKVDYLSFVQDGWPTPDSGLGRSIELLRDPGVQVALISNASLLDRADVRRELRLADWVSLKVVAVREPSWRKARPHERRWRRCSKKAVSWKRSIMGTPSMSGASGKGAARP
jgi:wyosine [tRNA(Phe)-imidazoG37] synthetase (radical SAM superfamily)